MMTDGKHEGTPPEAEEDALWRLLERAPRPEPASPYFARRVLREVALLEEARPAGGGVSHWLARIRQAWQHQPRWALAGALTAVVLLAAGGTRLSSRRGQPAVVASNLAPAVADVSTGQEPAPVDPATEIDPGPQGAVAVASDPVVTAQDVEVIADLDNLLSREESRLWTEDDTARF